MPETQEQFSGARLNNFSRAPASATSEGHGLDQDWPSADVAAQTDVIADRRQPAQPVPEVAGNDALRPDTGSRRDPPGNRLPRVGWTTVLATCNWESRLMKSWIPSRAPWLHPPRQYTFRKAVLDTDHPVVGIAIGGPALNFLVRVTLAQPVIAGGIVGLPVYQLEVDLFAVGIAHDNAHGM